MGQLAFFIEYLKQGGLFDGWVAGCPLYLTSPNAPAKRDVLGTVLLSALAGHWRYAHITALRADAVNAPLLGMKKVVSEDAVRRALGKIDEAAGIAWLREQLEYSGGNGSRPAPRPHEHVHRPGEERRFRDRRELGGHRPGRGDGAVCRGVRPGTDRVVSWVGCMR